MTLQKLLAWTKEYRLLFLLFVFNDGLIKVFKDIVSDVKGHLEELTRPSTYLVSGCACLGFCVLIGLFIAATRTLLLLPIGVIGVGMGMFYTVPPLKQRFRLLGLTAWFLTVPLCALGAFMVQVPILSFETLLQHSHTFWLIVARKLSASGKGMTSAYFINH